MNFPFFWKKNDKNNGNDALSYFLLHASDKEKKRIFTEAAHRANKDQQDLVERSKKPQTI